MRRKTNSVKVGKVNIGSDFDIVVQSMVTSSTLNTIDCINEAIEIIEAGSQLVRFTAPNIKEAKNLGLIKKGLIKKGYDTPLVADIHFTPNAALEASSIVEKVRINPGNFIDRKKFLTFEYTDEEYNLELEKIEEKLIPLIESCKKHNTALRIGTNHGSLSDRIMNRYGDTPLGMVESALEFLRICKKNNFDQVVLSMKSSNPLVMVHAYRLLVYKMNKEEMFYPLHLGVTEAGDGIDGRIKSSIGIGLLLLEGIGDTIRVSLTEDSKYEIPVCKQIIDKVLSTDQSESNFESNRSFSFLKRQSNSVYFIGGEHAPVVISDSKTNNTFKSDLIFSEETNSLNPNNNYVIPAENLLEIQENVFPLFSSIGDFRKSKILSSKLNFLILSKNSARKDILKSINSNLVIILDFEEFNRNEIIELLDYFEKENINFPVIFKCKYLSKNINELAVHASIDIGTLLLEGFGDGIWLNLHHKKEFSSELAFTILQNTRRRIFKTDYISCPSCGRTQFDLQKTTNLVKEFTSHLKGLKISVMGCIVNGPGEMADADYGYVGSGKGKISLYKGKELIQRNVDSKNAVDELINLIKANNDWIEP